MSPEHQLSLRPQQRLIITPALRQSLYMLQIPSLELQSLVQQELAENPLLQEQLEEPEEETTEELVEHQQEALDMPNRTTEVNPDDVHPREGLSLQEWEDYFSSETSDLGFVHASRTDEQKGSTEVRDDTKPASLSEYLADQLRVAQVDDALGKAAEVIIGNLDHRGFLVLPIEELAEAEEIDAALLERALVLVQGFEPTGVAARSLQECLLIQLQQKSLHGSLAHRVIVETWEELEHKRFGAIAKKLGVSSDEVQKAIETIAHLNPRPARNFYGEPMRYVVPDVYVDEMDGRFIVRVNDDGVPRLGVHKKYVELLRHQADSLETKKFIEEKLQSAVWLVRGIEQRKRSIFRVAEAIVKNQEEYLRRGIEYLKPLTLQDIANQVGLHESTVSRVTMSKYMQTPRGMLPMKFFFTHALESTNGQAQASVASVKELVRDLCEETSDRPLSDQQLVQKLSEKGVKVARRTVAKYREELGIAVASVRRRTKGETA